MENTQLIVSELKAIDNFRYIEKIGEGGYGLVFKAEQISTGKFVAIKILKIREGIKDHKKKQQLARFERETQLSAEINHPNIVQLLDKGYSDNGEPYAVFEYVQGETLKSYILRHKRLLASEMAFLMGQVLDALVCAHKKGIVHRDLKPHNIMVSKLGSKNHVKILDFGIGAFTRDFRSLDYQNLTITQDVLGTPIYSAPEQLRGEPPTVKSDLYSWGLIVIECLTGKPVMDGASIVEVFQKQLMASSIPLPPSIIGHPLAGLLRRVLEKNPRNRAEEAQGIFDEFEQINFNTLIGDIDGQKSTMATDHEYTVADEMVWSGVTAARKQMTIFCVKLNLVVSKGIHLDLETLDTIQKDQLNLCKDFAIRYGGHVSGTFMNNFAVYFGYPESNDTDARRAGRAALEMVAAVKKRNVLLLEQQAISVDIRIGLHVGTVLVQLNNLPEGSVPNMAFDLVYRATSGSVLVSGAAKKLLEPYLEFERVNEIQLSNNTQTIETYQLVGERQTEALSSLRPWSADREMIGRNIEKDIVLKSWDNASARGNAVIISGQAGIGKSKLVHEVKKEVRSMGAIVRACRCLPEHQNNALFPFFKMLKNHWEITEIECEATVVSRLKKELKKASCSIEECLPLLCSWLLIPLSDKYTVSQRTAEHQKKVLFKTLKQCLLSLDKGKSFLLVLEDLHWLDPTSQEFIEYLLSDITKHRYLLLMTSRPVFENTWDLEYLSRVDLEVLSNNSIELLVKDCLGGKSISNKMLDYISGRADGIPFYAEEMTSMLFEQNYIEVSNGVYDLVKDFDAKLVPMTLQDLLNARIDHLGLAKETAQLAASIGREFNYELLSKASLKDKAAIQSDLDQLIKADLVYRKRRAQGENYIFKHALIRDAAYNGMPNLLKINIHKTIANCLEAEFYNLVTNDPSLLAFHWSYAQDYEKASFYGMNSTSNALARSLFTQCISQANEALSWVANMEDGTLKIERELQINQSLVQGLIAIKGFANIEVKIINDRSEELCLLLPNGSDWLLNILWTRIQFNLMSANYSQFEVLWLKAEKEALKLNQKPLLCALYGVKGYKNWLFGKYDKAENELVKSIEIYDDIDGQGIRETFGIDYKVYSKMVLANVYAFKGNFERSETCGREGMQMMENLNDAHTKAYALSLYLSLYFYRNEIKKIELLYEQYIGFLREHDFTSFLYLFDTLRGWIDSNVEMAKKNRDLIDSTGVKAAGTYYSFVVAQTAYNAGEFEVALQQIEDILLQGAESGEEFQFAESYRLQAMCLSKLTSPELEKKLEFQ